MLLGLEVAKSGPQKCKRMESGFFTRSSIGSPKPLRVFTITCVIARMITKWGWCVIVQLVTAVYTSKVDMLLGMYIVTSVE